MPDQYLITGRRAGEIAASIERAIDQGTLKPGDRLPAIRRLASQLSVSPATVASALADLRSRGLVMSRSRSGTHVSWRPPMAGPWLGPILPVGTRDLASGNPDPRLLPDLAALLGRIEPPQQLYGSEPVLPELRQLALAELRQAGIGVEEEIVVTSGALDGIERALQAQLRPGDAVAVEDPGFAGLFDLLRAMGLALRPVVIDSKGMIPAELALALEDGVSAVLVNPRGQNPTGASLDGERANELRRVLHRRPDVMVLEDDHLGPVAGSPRLTLTSGRRRWAVARSVAKSLGPDLRLAILAADPVTISRVAGRQAVGPQWVSHLLQRLVATAWASPEVDALIARAADTYRSRRKRLLSALRERGIETVAPAGINVWVEVPEEAHVAQSLLAKGFAVTSGAPYRLRSGRAIRITTSTLQAGEADQLASAIEAALLPGRRTRTA